MYFSFSGEVEGVSHPLKEEVGVADLANYRKMVEEVVVVASWGAQWGLVARFQRQEEVGDWERQWTCLRQCPAAKVASWHLQSPKSCLWFAIWQPLVLLLLFCYPHAFAKTVLSLYSYLPKISYAMAFPILSFLQQALQLPWQDYSPQQSLKPTAFSSILPLTTHSFLSYYYNMIV